MGFSAKSDKKSNITHQRYFFKLQSGKSIIRTGSDIPEKTSQWSLLKKMKNLSGIFLNPGFDIGKKRCILPPGGMIRVFPFQPPAVKSENPVQTGS